MELTILMMPSIIVTLTSLGSLLLLVASKHIKTEESENQMAGHPYSFSQKTYADSVLYGGLFGLIFLYILPIMLNGHFIFHWIPLLMVCLLTVQSLIDLHYFELADEWTIAVLLLSLTWVQMNRGLTMESLYITLGLFMIYFVSWFFFDFPGFGDVKLVFAAGVMVNGIAGGYNFFMFASLTAVIGTLLGCIADKKPINEWMRTTFAYGPYLSMAIAMAMIGYF